MNCPKCNKPVNGPPGSWCSLCAQIYKGKWAGSRGLSLIEAEAQRNQQLQDNLARQLAPLFRQYKN